MNLLKTTAILFPLALTACDQGPNMTAEDLMEVEREFAQYSLDHGFYEAFATHLSEDAVTLNSGSQPTIGIEEALARLEGGQGELFWYPVGADVAKSGDLGYTWGRYTFTGTNEAGETVVSHGKYMSVWKKQPDGTWKVVLDGGNDNPPPVE